jgi:hypothetical protein
MSELIRKRLSRHDFLRASATVAGASLLAACAPVTPAPAAPPVAEKPPAFQGE